MKADLVLSLEYIELPATATNPMEKFEFSSALDALTEKMTAIDAENIDQKSFIYFIHVFFR